MSNSRVVFNFPSRIFLTAMLACAPFATAQEASKAGPPAVRTELLVSSAWLKAHLRDREVVVLHVADKRQDFQRGHIPGARFLATADFIVADTEPMNEIPPQSRLKETFESLGVTDRSTVILYTTGYFPNATRAFFTLEYLGHTRTAMLDGGIDRWIDEGLPVEAGSSRPKRGSITIRLLESVKATVEEVKRASEDPVGTVQVVDSRPPRRYTAGHIPGARGLFWQETLQGPDNPMFLPPDRLRTMMEARGIQPGRKIISYCETGMQATVGYFLARYLGLEATMYDGSFHEWNDLAKLPMVKGENPK
jgi:thiosulfate/3-mercaptopyruvate sulfurtransferase